MVKSISRVKTQCLDELNVESDLASKFTDAIRLPGVVQCISKIQLLKAKFANPLTESHAMQVEVLHSISRKLVGRRYRACRRY